MWYKLAPPFLSLRDVRKDQCWMEVTPEEFRQDKRVLIDMANTYCTWQMLIKYLTYDNSFFDGCVFEKRGENNIIVFSMQVRFQHSYCQVVLVHGQTAATDSRRATPGRNPTSAQTCFLHNYPCVRGIHPWPVGSTHLEPIMHIIDDFVVDMNQLMKYNVCGIVYSRYSPTNKFVWNG